ncbi:IS110 family transposase [Agrobacterium pusense]|uniref:IS110 family transposase n=1 Tax=Agrobacterium pusense TaxID=648995 RepID=A0A6H0ZTI1_9HYPH|nr:IS110 family transposase [Agrobacterium pusense]KGE79753.1 transposase [Rhizobium sp. H41]MDH2089122.1 IS110 family transposase [Agrobacterium pusense]QIX23090.1 IS110 family transposase [Agrobacterium pusense]QWW76484.1 IS110 family transposase [Agrobacterium pusense]WCK27334.1 IS110 family transposase [Agrobacterium pusense]
MQKVVTVGLDIAKQVFQAHGADASGETIFNTQIKREDVREFFSKLKPCLIGMETCATSYYWARQLLEFGHDVRLVHTSYVKPFVKRSKTDANDAEAINVALTQKTMRFVPVKTLNQQAAVTIFRTRSLFVSQRTQLVNALRGHLAEAGLVAAKGIQNYSKLVNLMETAADTVLPTVMKRALTDICDQIHRLNDLVTKLDKEIEQRVRDDEDAGRLLTIPGVGPKTAMCVIATLPDIHRFPSGRHFSSWLGLTPRSHSSGGRSVLGRITKMGNAELRKMLYLGASAVIVRNSKTPIGLWAARLRGRRPYKVAVIAVANRIARIVWALLTKGGLYDPEYGRAFPRSE